MQEKDHKGNYKPITKEEEDEEKILHYKKGQSISVWEKSFKGNQRPNRSIEVIYFKSSQLLNGNTIVLAGH